MSAQYSVLSSLDYIWELVCTEAIVSTVNHLGDVIIMGNILNYCLMGLRWIYNRPAPFKFSIPPVLAECVMQIEWQIFQIICSYRGIKFIS